MTVSAQELAQKHCTPCEGGTPKMQRAEVDERLAQLHEDWTLDESGPALYREFKFKGFAKTMYFVNALAYLADQEGHHPDVSFGWGYCQVRFSTHAIGGLSENDFICAAKVDQLTNR